MNGAFVVWFQLFAMSRNQLSMPLIDVITIIVMEVDSNSISIFNTTGKVEWICCLMRELMLHGERIQSVVKFKH